MNRAGLTFGALLIVLGVASLAYGGFNYTENETAVKMGPLQIDVEKDKRLNIPVWAGIALSAVGGVLVVAGASRR